MHVSKVTCKSIELDKVIMLIPKIMTHQYSPVHMTHFQLTLVFLMVNELLSDGMVRSDNPLSKLTLLDCLNV